VTLIPVLIPTTRGNASDGFLCGNLPTPQDYASSGHSHEPEEDRLVQVVPPDALQALLTTKGFVKFERRFGTLTKSQKAHICATFYLIEEWRSGDPKKRSKYLGWTQSQREAEEWFGKGPESAELAKHLFESDKALVEAQGLQGTVTDLLNRRGEVRVWRNKHTNGPCPGIFVKDFVEALFVLLLLNLTDPNSEAICARCKKPYLRTKSTQLFCTQKCANNARKTRQRIRKRNQEAAGGTHKAR
jgi:hypothetical protein